jgi:hypothetical protein
VSVKKTETLLPLDPIVFTPTTFRYTKRLPIRISRPSHKKFHFKNRHGECNKNASTVASLFTQQTFSQKLVAFSLFHLTKRMTFMPKFTKLHSYVLKFLNYADVLWVAFSIPSSSLSRVKYPIYTILYTPCIHYTVHTLYTL